MKCKSFKIFIMSILLLFVTSLLFVEAKAASFAGGAGYNWNVVSNSATITGSNKTVAVKWSTSSQASHKMWFGVYQNGSQVGQSLFSYLASASVSTTSTKNISGHLAAHREHVGNPSTYITGTWSP